MTVIQNENYYFDYLFRYSQVWLLNIFIPTILLLCTFPSFSLSVSSSSMPPSTHFFLSKVNMVPVYYSAILIFSWTFSKAPDLQWLLCAVLAFLIFTFIFLQISTSAAIWLPRLVNSPPLYCISYYAFLISSLHLSILTWQSSPFTSIWKWYIIDVHLKNVRKLFFPPQNSTLFNSALPCLHQAKLVTVHHNYQWLLIGAIFVGI